MKSDLKYLEFYQHVSLHVKCFQIFGLWFFIPYPKLSVQFWLHIFIRIVTGIFVFIIPPLGQITYVVKLLMTGTFEIQEIASSINLILTELMVSLKILDLFRSRNLLIRLMDQLNNNEFQRNTHRNVLKKAIKLSRQLFWCLLIGSSLDVFFHVVVVPGMDGFRTLPVKMDLIFLDVNEPMYFDYVCLYQIMYKPTLVAIYIALQTLPWAFLTFAIAQLDILINNFENMKKLVEKTQVELRCIEEEAFKEVFNSFILHHQAIIRFLITVEKLFGGQFALNLVLCSGVICTTGVQLFAIESPSKDLVGVIWVLAYLQIFVGILFTDCYFGNAVYVKSTDLSTVAYGCPWFKMHPDVKKNLLTVITRAQKPLEITAYGLVSVSLPTFTRVLNWSYKAFAVMNEMKK